MLALALVGDSVIAVSPFLLNQNSKPCGLTGCYVSSFKKKRESESAFHSQVL